MSTKEVESISQRVQKKRKEIEKIKAEIQELAESGFKPPKLKFLDPFTSLSSVSPFKNDIEKRETVSNEPPAKSPDKGVLVKKKPVIQKKSPLKSPEPQTKNIPCNKKDKRYNVEETREYIKKQREKRAEQFKSQAKTHDNAIELKKEKLKELHQKSLQLVQKNIQMTRERSKSRCRDQSIRLDKISPRQKSGDRLRLVENNLKHKSRSRPETITKPTSPTSTKDEASNNNFLKPAVLIVDIQEFDKSFLIAPQDESLNHINPAGDNNNKPVLQVSRSEHAIMTDNCEKDTKETQTKNYKSNFDDPPWLKPTQVQSYPYNFINTVKRKLQTSINEPKRHVDVGIQNSSIRSLNSSISESERPKSREEIKQNLMKSVSADLKSFTSHKCNLDLKNVENLELKSPIKAKSASKSLFGDESFHHNSESDTSKNIPDISSESIEVSRKAKSSCNGDNVASKSAELSLSNLKDLKLQTHILDKPDTNLSSIHFIPDLQVETNYSSDFVMENEGNSSIKSLSTISRIPTDDKSHRNYNNDETTGKSITIVSESLANKSVEKSKDNSSIYLNNNKNRSSTSDNSTLKSPNNNFSVSKKSNENSNSVTTSMENSESIKESNFENVELPDSETIQTDQASSSKKSTSRRTAENQHTFNSLLTEGKITPSIFSMPSRHSPDHSTIINELSLKEPPVSLTVRNNLNTLEDKMRNITIRHAEDDSRTHKIHLKFEAEVRLLDDFRGSVRRFKEAEKEYEDLKNKTLQNVDTQTSNKTQSNTSGSSVTKTTKSVNSEDVSKKSRINSLVNFSRGFEIEENLDGDLKAKEKDLSYMKSTFSWDMSSVFDTTCNTSADGSKFDFTLANLENINANPCAGWSLNIFKQLIKDEDARIQHLKAIIKIREQALLDRTKTELVFLELKRKQLLEAGRLEEASLLRKKQRGIILKGEQERNEIKKLKQMQKESSKERKNFLQRQRNLIKSGLSTDNMMSKIKVNTPRERRRTSGPLKVVQSCSESVRSETFSRKSSAGEEVLSVVSLTKSVRTSEEEGLTAQPVDELKRTLLMRESALEKRRKATEQLMRWHQKLLDEEKKICDLEAEAFSVIKNQPKPMVQEVQEFTGKQLNQLWRTMTGSDDRKYTEDKIYKMSQVSLERFYKSAKQYNSRNTNNNKKNRVDSQSEHSVASKTLEESIKSDTNYSTVFEADSGDNEKEISSISELISSFNKIGDEIELLSKKTEKDLSSIDQSEHTLTEEINTESKVKSMTPHQESKIEDHADTPVDKSETLNTDEEINTSQISESPKLSNKKDEKETISFINILPEHSVESITSQETEKTPQLEEAKKINDSESIPIIIISSESETEEEEIKEESYIINTSSQKSLDDEILSLDEALEAASKIEESLTNLNNKLIPDEKASNETVSDDKETEESATQPSLEESKVGTEIIEEVSYEEKSSGKISQIIISNEKSVESVSDEKEKSSGKLSDNIASSEKYVESFADETSKSSNEHISETKDHIASEKSSTKEFVSEVAEISEKSSEKSLSNEGSADSKSSSEGKSSSELIEEKSATNTDSKSVPEEVSLSQDSQKSVPEEKSHRSSQKETSDSSKSISDEKTPKKIDVKKRVSEILADANGHANRGDKSPRIQDLYMTTYDVSTPTPEYMKPPEGRKSPPSIFGSEAEELWRKQMEIEQEIKQLEQQQKEQIPYVFMREIPNKPPPPYTPPSSLSVVQPTILPKDAKEINEITNYSSKIIYKAYQKNTLDNVKYSENSFKLCSKMELPKMCGEFLFNICRDLAKEHYKQFEEVAEPSWLKLEKKSQLSIVKPLDAVGLEKYLNKKLKEMFGFKKVQMNESAIIKWGRKRRDHVDEILVIESQEEEAQWINLDKDELIVKDKVTNDIMKSLLDESAEVFQKILAKKKYLY